MSICPRCGAGFSCGMADASSSGSCWCVSLPALPREAYIPAMDDPAGGRCFCPNCLRALLAAGTPLEGEKGPEGPEG